MTVCSKGNISGAEHKRPGRTAMQQRRQIVLDRLTTAYVVDAPGAERQLREINVLQQRLGLRITEIPRAEA